MNYQQALDAFLLAKEFKSPRTLEFYSSNLRVLGRSLGLETDIASVTTQQLREWITSLQDTGDPHRPIKSAWSVHAYGRAMRCFFAWLYDEEIIPKDPARRVELPALPDTPRYGIPDADRDKMLHAAKNNPRDYAILLFFATTGCRLSGAANLRVKDLELDINRATVHEKGRGGNNNSRTVHYSQATQKALKAWIELTQAQGEDQVFDLTNDGIYQVFKRIAARQGIAKAWYPHNWRHAFARAFLRNGGDIGILSQIMGHKSINVTIKHYGKLNDAALHEAHKKYAPQPQALSKKQAHDAYEKYAPTPEETKPPKQAEVAQTTNRAKGMKKSKQQTPSQSHQEQESVAGMRNKLRVEIKFRDGFCQSSMM